jgi:hypothetical protein
VKGDWFISQCLDMDVANQGGTDEEALANLREALELHFERPVAKRPHAVRRIEVEVGAGLNRWRFVRSSAAPTPQVLKRLAKKESRKVYARIA